MKITKSLNSILKNKDQKTFLILKNFCKFNIMAMSFRTQSPLFYSFLNSLNTNNIAKSQNKNQCFQKIQKMHFSCPNEELKKRVNLATLSKHCYIEQINTGCIAQFAFYIESKGKAAIVDPIRDINYYIDLLKKRNAKLEYILETHFHADFVSGHLELAKKTGAKIVFGPTAKAEFDFYLSKHEELLPLSDKISIQVLHTPGHTMESSCFSVVETDTKKTIAVATGDTLFLGEVGRPDLAVKSNLTKEDLAGMLYDSIEYLKKLPDDSIVLPGHGSGSACGKNIQSGEFSTIKIQKDTNYALKDGLKKSDFVTLVSSNLPTPPSYFFVDAVLNKSKIVETSDVIKSGMKAYTPDEFEKISQNQNVKILDTRDNIRIFEEGLLPLHTYAIDLKMNYAIWAATFIHPKDKLLILSNDLEESIVRLTRVGFDNIIGYLDGGVDSWKKSGKKVLNVKKINTDDMIAKINKDKNTFILDVRGETEYKAPGIVENSKTIVLTNLEGKLKELPKNKEIHIMCKSGMRATVAASILISNGFKEKDIFVIGGGIEGFIGKNYKLVSV